MCRVGPQTHGPLKPGPFEPGSARLNNGPGMGLSRAWEFKMPRLKPWPGLGCLFSRCSRYFLFLPNLDMVAVLRVCDLRKSFYRTGARSFFRCPSITCMLFEVFKQLYHPNLIIFSAATISIIWNNLLLIIIGPTPGLFRGIPAG
jgi:hypothetical protein